MSSKTPSPSASIISKTGVTLPIALIITSQLVFALDLLSSSSNFQGLDCLCSALLWNKDWGTPSFLSSTSRTSGTSGTFPVGAWIPTRTRAGTRLTSEPPRTIPVNPISQGIFKRLGTVGLSLFSSDSKTSSKSAMASDTSIDPASAMRLLGLLSCAANSSRPLRSATLCSTRPSSSWPSSPSAGTESSSSMDGSGWPAGTSCESSWMTSTLALARTSGGSSSMSSTWASGWFWDISTKLLNCPRAIMAPPSAKDSRPFAVSSSICLAASTKSAPIMTPSLAVSSSSITEKKQATQEGVSILVPKWHDMQPFNSFTVVSSTKYFIALQYGAQRQAK